MVLTLLAAAAPIAPSAQCMSSTMSAGNPKGPHRHDGLLLQVGTRCAWQSQARCASVCCRYRYAVASYAMALARAPALATCARRDAASSRHTRLPADCKVALQGGFVYLHTWSPVAGGASTSWSLFSESSVSAHPLFWERCVRVVYGMTVVLAKVVYLQPVSVHYSLFQRLCPWESRYLHFLRGSTVCTQMNIPVGLKDFVLYMFHGGMRDFPGW